MVSEMSSGIGAKATILTLALAALVIFLLILYELIMGDEAVVVRFVICMNEPITGDEAVLARLLVSLGQGIGDEEVAMVTSLAPTWVALSSESESGACQCHGRVLTP